MTLACNDTDSTARTELSVFAASSLTEAFEDLARDFEDQNPAVAIRLTFAGSQVLRLQLEQGADADLFASANEAHMRALLAAGVIAESHPFAHNRLVVIVPPDNPAGIRSFADLTKAGRLVIGTESVPIGVYTRRVLTNAERQLGEGFASSLRSSVVSEEGNVRLVRAKVELGEADAAFVYRTDARASGNVRTIAIPPGLNVETSYPIGLLSGAKRAALGAQFMAYVLSRGGQRILVEHGFAAVSP